MSTFVYKKIDLEYEDRPFDSNTTPLPKHMHNGWEFYFLKHGNVSYSIESVDYSVISNDLLIIPPRTFHMLKKNDAERYARFTFNFYEDLLPMHIVEILKTLNAHYRIPRNRAVDIYFDNIVRYNDILPKEQMYSFIKNSLEMIILDLHYNEENTVITGNNKEYFFTDIITFINDNISKPITLDDICNHFYVSKSLIFHKFKSKFNISIMQYVSLRKILYAQNLIFSGTPPTEACYNIGYKDYSTFYRQYKKCLNRSPEQDKNAVSFNNPNK